MNKCSIDGCEKQASVRDLCGMHYARLKRHGTTNAPAKFFGTPEQRFLTKVEKTDSCWIWKASKHRDGYGIFNAGKEPGSVMAHRFSFERHHGPIPDSQCVCHHCDNPSCVNPAHLFLGSHKENMDDRDAKGRVAAGEASGVAKITESQVMEIRGDSRTTREIAKNYGISHSHVSNIKRHGSWAHVA
jgi:DNA-binding CsgD family transcriptional regulator